VSKLYSRFKQTKNYRLEVYKDGEWHDAGDIYEEQSKKLCEKQMCSVNFLGQKVRMVMFVNTWQYSGVVKDKDFRK